MIIRGVKIHAAEVLMIAIIAIITFSIMYRTDYDLKNKKAHYIVCTKNEFVNLAAPADGVEFEGDVVILSSSKRYKMREGEICDYKLLLERPRQKNYQ